MPLMDGDQPTACAAVLVDLSDIRSAGQILISKRIATRTSESGTMFSVGWTGSIIATPEELLQDPRNRSNDHHMVKPARLEQLEDILASVVPFGAADAAIT